MKRMTRREQIIAVVAGVMILFFAVYKWFGLGEMLDDLGTERETLTTLRNRTDDYLQRLRLFEAVDQEYRRYASYSLPRDPNRDPADEFIEYVNRVIREIDPARRPDLGTTEEEPIEGVPNYMQILLPITLTQIQFPELIELLATFDRDRLLIQALEINCPPDQEPNLTVDITLSRFVSVDVPDEESDGEARQ